MFCMRKITWFVIALPLIAGLVACAENPGTSTPPVADSTPTIVIETFVFNTKEPVPTETQVPGESAEQRLPAH